MIPYIITEEKITLFLDSPVTVTSDQPAFSKIEGLLKSGDADAQSIKEILNSMNCKNSDSEQNKDYLSSALQKRLQYLKENGLPLSPIQNFIDNLKRNPSSESVKDLYGFLEACDLPITEDGCFLAYKKVKEDFTDCHTGTIDNSVGRTVKMNRQDVDPDRTATCSTGLHVCSRSYLKEFGGVNTIVVKVNPANVVSVPIDYNNSKMRVCEYTVIGVLYLEEGESIKPMFASTTVKTEEQSDAVAAAKKIVKNLDKAGKFTAYCEERNLPELLEDMTPKQRSALKKFCARLLFGKDHAAGNSINSCKSLSELKIVVCGQ